MIIAFSGKRGVGKTTAAKYLEDKHGFIRLSFADKLREISKEIFPFSELEFTTRKEIPFRNYVWTPRDFLVRMGEFVRIWDKNYFLKFVTDIISSHPTENFAIDDARFINEAESLRWINALIVRINRYESQNPYKTKLDHASEIDLDDYRFDFVISEQENSNLESLYNKLDLYLMAQRQ